MTWSLGSWARDPWGGGGIPDTAPPGQQLPPPIPGGTRTYYYEVLTAASPWARLGWAGAGLTPDFPGGGIVLVPESDAGRMRVLMWWPDTNALQLIRVDQDGNKTPVRGGYPLTVTAATRHNYATNPNLYISLAGYVPNTGSPTLTRIDRDGDPVTDEWAGRATNASAGTSEFTVPQALPAVAATIAMDLRFSARPTSVTFTVGWLDSVGGALANSVITLTANQINNSVNQWARQVGTVTPPVGAASVSTLKVNAGGMPAGGQLDWGRVVAENGTTDGSFFDGTTIGAEWTGTDYLSASVLAPVVELLDGECPLDVPVSYELYNPSLAGGRMRSESAVLLSNGRTWLTHPNSYSTPIVIDLRRSPVLTRGIEQGVFRPIARKFAVTISAAQRYSPEGSVEINAISYAERDALLELFDDASPVLVRTPYEYRYPTNGMWLSLGALTEDREDRKPWQDAWLLSAPFVEVAAPDPALVA